MSPKKKLKFSASFSSSFDSNKFVSTEAEKRYYNMVVHMSCIPNRGFENLEIYVRSRLRSKLGVVYKTTTARVNINGARIYTNTKEHKDLKVFV